jgi:superfamily II DNA helicase RecQ
MEMCRPRVGEANLLFSLCRVLEDDTFKRILQGKQFHLQLKSEQKEIIQNVLERKDSMAALPTGLRKEFYCQS